jgi:hypothetical protein
VPRSQTIRPRARIDRTFTESTTMQSISQYLAPRSAPTHFLATPSIWRKESVNDYIRMFRDTRNRCFQIHVIDKELAWLSFNGLVSYLRDKLDVT